MSKWQIVLLSVVALALLVLTVTTWGSVGSILCVFCLLIMGVSLLYRRFVLDRDEDTFDWDV